MSCNLNFQLVIEQGATFIFPVLYLNENGTPVNLTGYTAKMQIRETYPSDVALVTISTENGGIVIDPLIGRLDLTIDADITRALPAPWEGVYDVFVYAPTGGPEEKILGGQIIIDPQVTR